MSLKDDDIILFKYAHRLGRGELEKIIHDAIFRKGREPLEEYYLFIKELERFKNEDHKKTAKKDYPRNAS